MKLGFHYSLAKGFSGVVAQALKVGADCGQIFSRNPRSWTAKPLDEADAMAFQAAWRSAGLGSLAVHAPYLVNLASDQEPLRQNSIQTLAEEMIRAGRLGAQYVIVHPGRVKKGEDAPSGITRVIQAAVRVLEIAGPGPVRLLLETTSGQAGDLGQRFEELAEMVRGIEAAEPAVVGICLDTAHVFAAGYDLATPKGLDRTLMDFDRQIGLDRLAFLHLNDSRFGLGEKRDRHEALGRGRIGSQALARFIRQPELNHLCAVMETPRQSDEDDRLNMARARSWAGRSEP